MLTLDFLKAILPEAPWYFVATPNPSGKGFKHTPCESIERMVQVIEHLEQNSVLNIYHACAGFRDQFVERPVHADGETKLKRQYRIKENVALVKAFWLDLDIGEPEPNRPEKYPDQRTALLALNQWLIQTKLPRPMIISSGYGLHVYWPLTAAILPGQWRATATQLKELTSGLKLLTDPSRTSDEASVLRPVGTSNRKVKGGVAGSKPVYAMLPSDGQPIELFDYPTFHARVVASLKDAGIEAVKTDKSDELKVNPTDMIVPVGGFQKVSAHKIAEKCQQIRLFSTTGGVTEPHWYRSIQIINKTIEGPALAHEWSAKHPEYSEAATQAKLDQIAGMGPTLCATMKDSNPEGCANCPFAGKIATPMQLGMVVEEAPAPKLIEVVDGREIVTELPPPPYPFKRGTGEQPGLYIEIDQGVPVRFYPYDLYPFEVVNDEGKMEGRLGIRHWLPKEGWREFEVRLELIESPREFMGKFRNQFIHPENAKFMVAYVDAYLKSLQDQTKIKNLHTRMGWLDDHTFVLGNKNYTPQGAFPAGISSTVSEKLVKSYHSKGTWENWNSALKQYDRDGLEAHLFSIFVGFGAPLFKFTGHGGVIASMQGESNAGKTLAARAMASIYGSFEPFKAGKHDTFNARIERMGMLSNLPAYIDEITNIKAEEVSDLMYQFSQGEGRTRLRSDSSVREGAVWSTILLTSGNSSVIGRLMEAKVDPDAELMRVFEYEVPKHKWFEREMKDSVYDLLANNYGWAGQRYITYLTQLAPEDIRKNMKQMTDAFIDRAGFEGKERFWCALIGSVLYGMWLAQTCGAIKLDDPNATYQRLWKWCLSQVMGQRTTVSASKISGLEALTMFLNAHLADRLVVMEGVSGLVDSVAVLKPPAQHGKMGIEYNQTKGTIYIAQSLIRNWFSKNQLPANAIRKELIEKGVMVDHGEQDFKVTLGRGTQFKGGQTRVWHIDAKHPLLDAAVLLAQEPDEPNT